MVAPPDNDVLRTRALHVTHNGSPALTGVSLGVREGEILAVNGPRGSGKTTLLRCLSGQLPPQQGEIWFNSTPVHTMGPLVRERLRRERFGWIDPAPHLVPELTAWENVALPLLLRGAPHRVARPAAQEWLDRLDVGGCARKRPHALHQAERQRVAVARALVTTPAVIFADEPTAPLHRADRAHVLRTLMTAARSHAITVVLATHDPDLAALADRTVALLDGRLVNTLQLPPLTDTLASTGPARDAGAAASAESADGDPTDSPDSGALAPPGSQDAGTPSTTDLANSTPDTENASDDPDTSGAPASDTSDTSDASDTPDALDASGTPGTSGTPASDTSDTSDASDASDASDTPDTPDALDASGTPGTSGTPASDTSDTSGAPGTPGTPDTPSAPTASGTPSTPAASDTSDALDTADTLHASAAPGASSTPSTPSTPNASGTPGTTGTPGTPGTTGTPGAPKTQSRTSDAPNAPAAPSRPSTPDAASAPDAPHGPGTSQDPGAPDAPRGGARPGAGVRDAEGRAACSLSV